MGIPSLAMTADAVEVVPSMQGGGVAELPEGQVEGARGGNVRFPPPPLVVEGTLVLLLFLLLLLLLLL